MGSQRLPPMHYVHARATVIERRQSVCLAVRDVEVPWPYKLGYLKVITGTISLGPSLFEAPISVILSKGNIHKIRMMFMRIFAWVAWRGGVNDNAVVSPTKSIFIDFAGCIFGNFRDEASMI